MLQALRASRGSSSPGLCSSADDPEPTLAETRVALRAVDAVLRRELAS